MRKILIVIDMQNDFISGALGTSEAQAIVPNVAEKIKEYVKNGGKIIFTRDTHRKNYLETNEGKHLPVEHCIRETDGWQICDELIKLYDYPYIVDKESFGFDCWDIYLDYDEMMDAEIELVGVCTDICVVSNALILKALFPETKISVDANCCAGVTPEKHEAALAVMESCQIEIRR